MYCPQIRIPACLQAQEMETVCFLMRDQNRPGYLKVITSTMIHSRRNGSVVEIGFVVTGSSTFRSRCKSSTGDVSGDDDVACGLDGERTFCGVDSVGVADSLLLFALFYSRIIVPVKASNRKSETKWVRGEGEISLP